MNARVKFKGNIMDKKERNLKREEIEEFMKEFAKIISGIKINGKFFAKSANAKVINTNPDLSIEEIRATLKIEDKSKVEFLRQLYVRGGQSIIKRLFPDENIVNLPTISFMEEGNSIKLNY
jgi:hypothetical protein